MTPTPTPPEAEPRRVTLKLSVTEKDILKTLAVDPNNPILARTHRKTIESLSRKGLIKRGWQISEAGRKAIGQ